MDQDTEDIIQRGLIRTKHYEFNDHVGPHDRKKFFRDSQDTQEKIDILLGASQARSARRQTVRGRKVIRSLMKIDVLGGPMALVSGSSLGMTTTVWADPSNHNTTYGNGVFEWGSTLFPQFFHGVISLLMAAGSFNSNITINLLNAAGGVLKTASGSANCSNSGGGTDTLGANIVPYTHDSSGPISSFNAFQSIISGDPEMTGASPELWYITNDFIILNYTMVP